MLREGFKRMDMVKIIKSSKPHLVGMVGQIAEITRTHVVLDIGEELIPVCVDIEDIEKVYSKPEFKKSEPFELKKGMMVKFYKYTEPKIIDLVDENKVWSEGDFVYKDEIDLESTIKLNGIDLEKEKKELKLDSGKLRYDLLPFEQLEEIVKVLTYGANKYAPNNWKLVQEPIDRYKAATLRHLSAYMQGEELDQESGLPHLAHAGTNILFLLSFVQFPDPEVLKVV